MKSKNDKKVGKSKPNIIVSTKNNSMGNSLFRGQKIIDFQEPFQDSIRPVKNQCSNGETMQKVDDNYDTEDMKFEQVEIRDNMNYGYDSEIKDKADIAKNIAIQDQIEAEISRRQFSNHKGENFDKRNKNDLFMKSKYFNNLNVVSNANSNHYHNSSRSNEGLSEGTSNASTPYKDRINQERIANINLKREDKISEEFFNDKKTSHGSASGANILTTKQNSNTFALPTDQGSVELNDVDFLKTLQRLKQGHNLDLKDQHIIVNKNDDESRSYIREILDMYPDDNKINISSIDVKHFENDNFSINSTIIPNSRSLFNTNNNAVEPFTISPNDINNLGEQLILQDNTKTINLHHRGLNTNDLVEITNKRKNNANDVTSVDAYFRRRHLETVTRLERMKREKEEKELQENSYRPNLNKKSKEIVQSMNNKEAVSLWLKISESIRG